MAVEYKLWLYTPSLVGGVIAAIIFALLTGFHIFRLIKNRTWFCIPFVIGGLFETVGYAGRAAAHNDTVSTVPYIIQSILILLAPILFAASIYMILGRLIRRTNSSSLSMIKANWVTKIFVVGDIVCFFVQASGGGMLTQAKDQDDVKRGENIILGGLILQIVFFGFFVVVAGVWHRRLAATPTAAANDISWRRYITLLYTVSIFITVRNTCRVVEYALGRDGYLLKHEWTLYVYDFLPMMLTLATCTVWHDPNIKPHHKNDIEMRG